MTSRDIGRNAVNGAEYAGSFLERFKAPASYEGEQRDFEEFLRKETDRYQKAYGITKDGDTLHYMGGSFDIQGVDKAYWFLAVYDSLTDRNDNEARLKECRSVDEWMYHYRLILGFLRTHYIRRDPADEHVFCIHPDIPKAYSEEKEEEFKRMVQMQGMEYSEKKNVIVYRKGIKKASLIKLSALDAYGKCAEIIYQSSLLEEKDEESPERDLLENLADAAEVEIRQIDRVW